MFEQTNGDLEPQKSAPAIDFVPNKPKKHVRRLSFSLSRISRGFPVFSRGFPGFLPGVSGRRTLRQQMLPGYTCNIFHRTLQLHHKLALEATMFQALLKVSASGPTGRNVRLLRMYSITLSNSALARKNDNEGFKIQVDAQARQVPGILP